MNRKHWSIFIACLACAFLGTMPSAASTPMLEADVIITDVKVYPSPTAPPLPSGTVWIDDGVIVRVGPAADGASDPEAFDPEALLIRGGGRSLVAGLWNSHVHFTPPIWRDPRGLADGEVAELLVDMLTRYGFTSVVDTGSDPAWLAELRKRIDGGVAGPRILSAAGSFVGKDASPAYLDFKLPELETPEQAVRATREALKLEPDGIKIFTGSFMGPGQALHMSQPVVDAITRTAHAAGAWVIAHPQSMRGLELATHGGVDILAHTAPDAGALPAALVAKMVERGMALIPTLQLWRYELTRGGAPPAVVERFQAAGVLQLEEFAAAGGEVLFGTDVGYMSYFDPTEEYLEMAKAGLDYQQILASLTTAPARRFLGEADGDAAGTLSAGQPADLVLLDGDPAADVSVFAKTHLVLRGGDVIYRAAAAEATEENGAESNAEDAEQVEEPGPGSS